MTTENKQFQPTEPVLTTYQFSQLITQLQQEESWNKSGRGAKTLYKGNGLRLVLNIMKKGTEIKPHQANGPISVHCVAGHMRFLTDEATVELHQGEMLSLQEYVRHSVEAIEETAFLLTIGTPTSVA